MTIGVDIRMLAQGIRAGVQEYLINLLNYLPQMDPAVEYRLFYNGFRKVNLDFSWLDMENVKLFSFAVPNRILDLSIKLFGSPKLDAPIGGADVFFSPHFFPAPVSAKAKKVTTFHDLSFERDPNFFSFRKRLWHWQVQAKKIATQSDKIIAVSRSTKEDLVNLYRIPEENIEVVYSGIDNSFRPLTKEEIHSEKNRLRSKYGLPDNFVLYLGTIEPRKNIGGVIQAFNLLRGRKGNRELNLVLAGSFGWLYGDILKTAQNSPFRDAIKFLGFVAERDKVGLYNLADVFIYPSYFEGFGFPPLEAMACGIPTIVSSSSSLPEVAGDGAVIVDPRKIGDICDALKSVLEDQRLRTMLSRKGRERARQFSWQVCAEKTLSVLRGG